ncbi:MAG: hypothetical protein Q4P30_02475 [Eubacteriales bacterium]|nr:hypothetical protein [Eubacteriales bacterium]
MKKEEFRVRQRHSSKQIRASMTVEASLVIPMILFLLMSLLFLIKGFSTHREIQMALSQSVSKAALRHTLWAGLGHGTVGADFLAGPVADTEPGMILPRPDGRAVDYDYTCMIEVPLYPNPFMVRHMSLYNRALSKKWDGDCSASEEAEDTVFVTKTGTVYHESLNCPYLKPSTRAVDRPLISDLRNEGGAKYVACRLCMKSEAKPSPLYVTKYGTAYHRTGNCRGLKRDIMKVPRSEVIGKRGCSKCTQSK